MVHSPVTPVAPRNNPLLENFSLNEQSIQDDFRRVVQSYPFEIFLKEQWWIKDQENMGAAMKKAIVKLYNAHLTILLLDPHGRILRHYLETVSRINCTPEEDAEYNDLYMKLIWYQDALLARHLLDLYSEELAHSIRNVITKTTELTGTTITW